MFVPSLGTSPVYNWEYSPCLGLCLCLSFEVSSPCFSVNKIDPWSGRLSPSCYWYPDSPGECWGHLGPQGESVTAPIAHGPWSYTINNVSFQQRRLRAAWAGLGGVLPASWVRESLSHPQQWGGHTWSAVSPGERGHWKAVKMIHRLEHLLDVESLRELVETSCIS